MINTSNEFKRLLFEDNRNYLEQADITLKSGTVLHLTNENIWTNGFKIEDSVSDDNKLDIGSAIVNKATLIINNIYDDYSEYDFEGASVVLKVGMELSASTERLNKGRFRVVDTAYNGSLITLTCYDNMSRFDQPYSLSTLTYPATLLTIIRDACNNCDVPIGTTSFPHSDFVISTRPDDEAITFREVISYCAQIAGCFARCDRNGRLELKWYDTDGLASEIRGYDGGTFNGTATPYADGDKLDGGTFKPWNTGDVADGGLFENSSDIPHIYSLYSQSISVDDVVITGVRLLVDSIEETEGSSSSVIHSYMNGSEGYIIEISKNPLINDQNATTILAWLSTQLIGLTYRKADISHGSDPRLEAGDVAVLIDRKQNVYPILISSTTFEVGAPQRTVSAADNPARRSASRFTESVKNYIQTRKLIFNEKTAREEAMDELSGALDSHSGLYSTVQHTESGDIFYLHDLPELSESKVVWKMTSEAWGVTTNYNGANPEKTVWNAGMTVDGDTVVRLLSAEGVDASWIDTGQLAVKKNGKEVLFVDVDTGVVRIVADSFSLSSGDTIQSISNSAASTAKSEAISSANSYTNTAKSQAISSANSYTDTAKQDAINTSNTYSDGKLSTYQTEVSAIVTGLQNQIDDQIMSWYYDYKPTLNNKPASDWNTTDLKEAHEGDIFFWKSKGYAYRFLKNGSTWEWTLIQDTDISSAIGLAQNAQDTADGKRRVFLAQPTPPYEAGDLWTQGSTGEILRCKSGISRAKGSSYVSSDWEKASKYTDDSALTTWINGDFATTISDLEEGIVDAKIETWYQTSDPSSNWNTSALKSQHAGDIWYNSTSTVQKFYRWNGSSWSEITSTPPDAVFDTIDGKAQIFVSSTVPVPPYYVGDLWFDGTSTGAGDIYTCITSRTSGSSGVASHWQKRNKYTDDTVANSVQENLNAYKETVSQYVDDLQNQIDGQVEQWFTDAKPTTSNYPYNEWSSSEREKHIDDLCYDRSTGKVYRLTQTRGLLKIKFSSDCATESINYDWVQIFYEYDGKIYSTNKIGGNGNSNTIANAEVLIPVANFKLHWRTDTSQDSYYGFKIDSVTVTTVELKGVTQVSSYPSGATEQTMATDSYPESAHGSYGNSNNILYVCSSSQSISTSKSYAWVEIQDEDIQDALEQASKAQDTADGKRRVFITQPTPPYESGDLWSQGSSGDLLRCKSGISRASGASYVESDWEKASEYTDDTTALTVYGTCSTAAGTSEKVVSLSNFVLHTGSRISVKFTYANSSSYPTLNVNSTGAKSIYSYGARLTADSAYNWLAGSTVEFVYDGSYWQLIDNGSLGKVKSLDTSLDQDSIFNRLTNNGASQGIFLQDGQLYINMSYLQTGTLKVGGSNNGNGVFAVYDSSGTRVGLWNNNGLFVGNISGTSDNPSSPNTKIGTDGAITTKSLTASNYIYLDGSSSDSLFKIPTGTFGSVQVDKTGFTVKSAYLESNLSAPDWEYSYQIPYPEDGTEYPDDAQAWDNAARPGYNNLNVTFKTNDTRYSTVKRYVAIGRDYVEVSAQGRDWKTNYSSKFISLNGDKNRLMIAEGWSSNWVTTSTYMQLGPSGFVELVNKGTTYKPYTGTLSIGGVTYYVRGGIICKQA